MKAIAGTIRIALALAALLLPAPALAAPDGLSTRSDHRTALGKRLAAGGAPHDWQRIRQAIETSDAKADARADVNTGQAGLMTHSNEAVVERPVAPGIRCGIRSEAARRAIFVFGYNAKEAPGFGPALLAFDAYARGYNREIVTSGALGETTCAATGGQE